jgi:TonB family protein
MPAPEDRILLQPRKWDVPKTEKLPLVMLASGAISGHNASKPAPHGRENSEMPIVEQSSQLQVSSVPPQYSEHKQRRRMLIALVLLVCALALVLYRDRDILFPASPDEDSGAQTQGAPQTTAVSRPETTIVRQAVPSRAKAKEPATPPESADPSANGGPVVTSRAVLPPLEIEVVAGDQRQAVQATNRSIKIDMQPRNSISAHPAPAPVQSAAGEDGGQGRVNASSRVRLSPGTALVVSRPVQPDYPLLARQMKVQGSVILQALIGKEGTIQELQVLSGPAILSEAARAAVKQWHFKPYLQAGEPVETAAKITVNFTISTN